MIKEFKYTKDIEDFFFLFTTMENHPRCQFDIEYNYFFRICLFKRNENIGGCIFANGCVFFKPRLLIF